MSGVNRRLKFTQQHRLETARELELQQSFVKEQSCVVSALCALCNCQQDQPICGPRPSSQLDIYRQNAIQRFDIEVLVVVGVNHVTQVGITGKCGVFDSNL